jgi:excisionase family DNA binding protein
MPTATISLNNDTDILTLDETARALKVSRRSISTLIKRGDLRACRASSKIVRVFRKDINAYLEKFATLPAK